MKKNWHIIIFAILALISTVVITELSTQILKQGEGCINILFTDLCNPFMATALSLLPVFYGFVYLLTNSFSKQTIVTGTVSQENKTTSERIEEEMINQYAEKIEEIQGKIKIAAVKAVNLNENTEKTLWSFCNELNLSQGLLYKTNNASEGVYLLSATYAFIGDLESIKSFESGIGINGQVAKSGNPICVKDIPSDYLKIVSGLGESHPTMLMIIPIKNTQNQTVGIVEASSFGSLNTKEVNTVYQIAQNIFQEVI